MGVYSIPNLTANIRRIAVLNWKGGCGKSMISANLASYYANQDSRVALIDHDPQGTSLRWLNQRDDSLPVIHGINPSARTTQTTRSYNMRLPPGTQRVIFDTPAGLRGPELQELVRETDYLVIPVLPSDADIHSAAAFVAELLLDARVKPSGAKVGIVANRVKQNTVIYESLNRFLQQLQFPLITRLRDTQHYVRAAESGQGIFDLQANSRVRRDLEQWQPIIDWLEQDLPDGTQYDLNLA